MYVHLPRGMKEMELIAGTLRCSSVHTVPFYLMTLVCRFYFIRVLHPCSLIHMCCGTLAALIVLK